MMKQIRYIVTSLLLLGGLSLAQAQDQEVFPTKNAEWTTCCNFSDEDGLDFHLADYKISLVNRDTVCNQKNYHIFKERDYHGGFRVEAAKVWITFDWVHEYLLYDFDVNVGDTIWHGTIYDEMPPYRMSYPLEQRWGQPVMSIVEEVKNESEKKEIYVRYYVWHAYPSDWWESLGYDVWREGVGSLNGLFMSFAGLGPYLSEVETLYSYHTRELKCEGQTVYYDATIPEYPDGSDVSLNEISAIDLQVYYNESAKSLSIQSGNAGWEGIFYLYDLSGVRLSQSPVCGTTEIPLNVYSSGYYLCEIVCGSRIVYSSKIKI